MASKWLISWICLLTTLLSRIGSKEAEAAVEEVEAAEALAAAAAVAPVEAVAVAQDLEPEAEA